MGMQLDEYTAQQNRNREIAYYEQLKRDNEAYKQELSSVDGRITNLNGIIRNKDNEINQLRESQGRELNKQSEQFNSIIEKIQAEKQELQQQIELKDDEIAALKEVEVNIAPAIESLEEKINELPSKMDEFEEFNAKLFSTKFDEMQAEMLTEIDKITSEKMKGIQTDVAKIYESVASRHESITIIDLQNIKIEIENSISQKLDEKIHYLDEGMNGMIDILKEHIDSMPKPTAESLKVPIYETKEEVAKVEVSKPSPETTIIDDADTELSEDMVHANTTSQIEPSNKASTDDTNIELNHTTKDNDEVNLSPNQKKVADYLKKNPGKTNKEISQALNLDKATVSKVLKSLLDKSIIVKNKDDTYEVKSL